MGGHCIRRDAPDAPIAAKSMGWGSLFQKSPREAGRGKMARRALGWCLDLTIKPLNTGLLVFFGRLKTRGEGGETVGGYNVYRQTIL